MFGKSKQIITITLSTKSSKIFLFSKFLRIVNSKRHPKPQRIKCEI